MQEPDGSTTTSVRAVARALELMTAFARAQSEESTLEDLARTCNLAKSTTHRLLDTLVTYGFVDPGSRVGSYRLGLQAAVVGRAAAVACRPDDAICDIVRRIRDETGETAGLNVRDGHWAVRIEQASSRQPLQWTGSGSGQLPLFTSAGGRAILSLLSEEAVESILDDAPPIEAMTDHTVTDRDALINSIRDVRQTGHALDNEELRLGLRCLAVPVPYVDGDRQYALGISAPASRLRDADVDAIAQCLHAGAEDIASLLSLRHA